MFNKGENGKSNYYYGPIIKKDSTLKKDKVDLEVVVEKSNKGEVEGRTNTLPKLR